MKLKLLSISVLLSTLITLAYFILVSDYELFINMDIGTVFVLINFITFLTIFILIILFIEWVVFKNSKIIKVIIYILSLVVLSILGFMFFESAGQDGGWGLIGVFYLLLFFIILLVAVLIRLLLQRVFNNFFSNLYRKFVNFVDSKFKEIVIFLVMVNLVIITNIIFWTSIEGYEVDKNIEKWRPPKEKVEELFNNDGVGLKM